MKRIRAGLVAALLVAVSAGLAAAGEVYRWVDAQGTVHFSDAPPEKGAPVSTHKVPDYKSNEPAAPGGALASSKTAADSAAAPAPKTAPQAAVTPKVELYSTTWCSFCKSARAYFKARGIPITEYDVEDDEAALRRFRAMNPGGGVPYAVINGKGIFGFNEEAYDAVLGPKP
jgi:glutaredoxin